MWSTGKSYCCSVLCCCQLPPSSQHSKLLFLCVQTGWLGLKSLYANVASTVESAAKDSGYNISLGSKAVANSLQQQQLQQQLQQQVQQQRYGGYSHTDSYTGKYSNGVHKSASDGIGFATHSAQQPGGGSTGANGRNGFAGFDEGVDGESQATPVGGQPIQCISGGGPHPL